MDAAVLPAVLIVGTLMLLAVTAVLNLFDIGNGIYYRSVSDRQKEAWLDAAFLLYRQDGSLSDKGGGTFTIFDDEPSSEVTLESSYWGLYEMVVAGCDGGKTKRAGLIGTESGGKAHVALYVPDNRRSLTIAGNSNIKGGISIPGKGIVYGQVKSDFYSGERVPEELVFYSPENLPEPRGAALDSLASMARKTAWHSVRAGTDEVFNSFLNPTLYILADSLAGMILKGNIVVSSDDRIVLDRTSILEDIILLAPKIFIQDGFSGCLQAFATDSLVAGKDVNLRYPSGLALTGGNMYSHLRLGSGGRVDGYVICHKKDEKEKRQTLPNYLQDEGAKVRGLVWADGIAEIHGTVTGSLYAAQPNYYAPQGFYVNMLYNARIYGSSATAFPLWMCNGYPKKTAKWLY